MNRFLAYISAGVIAISSIGLNLFFINNVSAATPYDSMSFVTNLTVNDDAGVCEPLTNLHMNFISVILDSNRSTFSGSGVTRESVVDSIDTHIVNDVGGRFFAQVFSSTTGLPTDVLYVWNNTTGLRNTYSTTFFDKNSGFSGGTNYTLRFELDPSCGKYNIAYTSSSSKANFFVQLLGTNGRVITQPMFVYTPAGPLLYPSGYEGDEVPDTVAPPPVVIRPGMSYMVSQHRELLMNFFGYYQDDVKSPSSNFCFIADSPAGDCLEPELKVTIFDSNGNIVPQPGVRQGVTTLSDSVVWSQNERPGFVFPAYGVYDVQLDFVFPENAPGDWNYSEQIFAPTTLRIDVNGTPIISTTEEDTCTDGVCSPNVIECDFGDFACVMRQFMTNLLVFTNRMFVPSPEFLNSYFSNFNNNLVTKLGFIAQSFTIGVQFFGQVRDAVVGSNGVCSWSFGNVFGSNSFKLNLCAFEQSFPTQFSIIRILIIGFTSFSILSLTYSAYRRIIG